MVFSVKPIQPWFPLPDAQTSLYTTGSCVAQIPCWEKCFVPAVRGVARREQSAVCFLGILSAAENYPPQGKPILGYWSLFMTVNSLIVIICGVSLLEERWLYYYLSKTAHYSVSLFTHIQVPTRQSPHILVTRSSWSHWKTFLPVSL